MIELISEKDKIAFKNLVKTECIKLINQRIANAKSAVSQAQDAANSSDKSTAGDKYETSRAMGQIDSDMNSKQLLEAEQELSFLEKIDVIWFIEQKLLLTCLWYHTVYVCIQSIFSSGRSRARISHGVQFAPSATLSPSGHNLKRRSRSLPQSFLR